MSWILIENELKINTINLMLVCVQSFSIWKWQSWSSTVENLVKKGNALFGTPNFFLEKQRNLVKN